MMASKPESSRSAGDSARSNASQNLAGRDGAALESKRLSNAPGQILAGGVSTRAKLRDHAAATVKVIALSGGLLGGLWLLQMVAQK